MTEHGLRYSSYLGGLFGTDADKGGTKCFVEVQFGDRVGLEIVALNEWQESYSVRSVELAKRVLKSTRAPKKSVEWAKRILEIK